MNTHTFTLANGWVATFENQGEFRMSAESWNLVLHGPDQRAIRYFHDQIVLVNDEDGAQASRCIRLSSDGVHGYLDTALGHGWVIDFARGMIAPHRIDIRHYHERYDESVSVTEQPTFKRARQYIQVTGKFTAKRTSRPCGRTTWRFGGASSMSFISVTEPPRARPAAAVGARRTPPSALRPIRAAHRPPL